MASIAVSTSAAAGIVQFSKCPATSPRKSIRCNNAGFHKSVSLSGRVQAITEQRDFVSETGELKPRAACSNSSSTMEQFCKPFIASLAALVLMSMSPEQADADTLKAKAVLKGALGVEGVVDLLQVEGEDSSTLTYNISGLSPGEHGFHVHQFGDLSNGCISTGPHFNPNKLTHGGPSDSVRHAGDLGNILANNEGIASGNILDGQVSLSGPTSVIGRAIVVHELADDFGKGGSPLSTSTGNAGGRLACGGIGISPP